MKKNSLVNLKPNNNLTFIYRRILLRMSLATIVVLLGLYQVFQYINTQVNFSIEQQIHTIKEISRIRSYETHGMLTRWANLIISKNIKLEEACGIDFILFGHNVREEFTTHYVVDENGNILCATKDFQPGISVKDREYFARAKEFKKPVISKFISGRLSNKPVVIYAAPILNSKGEFLGITATGLSLDWFNDDVSKMHLPKDSKLLITDDEGNILATYPNQIKSTGSKNFDSQTFSLILSAKKGFIEKNDDNGYDRIYGYEILNEDEDAKPTSFIMLGITKDSVLKPIIMLGVELLIVTFIMLGFELFIEKSTFLNYSQVPLKKPSKK